MTVIVVLHLTIDWHHSEWLGTVYDYDYNRTDPTHTDNHYDYDRMVLVYRNYHSLITTRFFATATITMTTTVLIRLVLATTTTTTPYGPCLQELSLQYDYHACEWQPNKHLANTHANTHIATTLTTM